VLRQPILNVTLTKAHDTWRIALVPDYVNARRRNTLQIHIFEWAPVRTVAALYPSYAQRHILLFLPAKGVAKGSGTKESVTGPFRQSNVTTSVNLTRKRFFYNFYLAFHYTAD
jgi:hypothetical protein